LSVIVAREPTQEDLQAEADACASEARRLQDLADEARVKADRASAAVFALTDRRRREEEARLRAERDERSAAAEAERERIARASRLFIRVRCLRPFQVEGEEMPWRPHEVGELPASVARRVVGAGFAEEVGS